MKRLSPAVMVLAFGCRAAPPGIAPEVIERHLAYLADDALEGRDSGTPGCDKAEEYIQAQLRAAGLDAVEARPFEFITGVRLGPGNSLSIAGRALPVEAFQPYPFSQSGAGEWPVVFAGYGIAAADLGHDDYQHLEVKGKAVVALEGAPGGDGPHGALAAHATARAKALKAKALGAAALILVVERLLPFDGEEVAQDVGLPVIAAAAPGAPGAARPFGLDSAREWAAHASGKPGEPAPDLRLRARVDLIQEKRTARNVLGWLRARSPEATEELVVLGAHHDGLGRGGASSLRRDRRGEVHNGADDNASGVAGVIELARRLGARAGDLRRSILFVTFAGEERGLLGSKRLAGEPLSLPGGGAVAAGGQAGAPAAGKPVAMVNLDMIGRMRDRKLLVSGAATSHGWPAVLAAAEARRRAARADPLSVSADRSEDLFGSSDHLSFYQAGLPVIFFFTGAHKEYHTPDDDLYRARPGGRRERLINCEGVSEALGFIEEVLLELCTRAEPPAHRAGVDLAPRMSFRVVLRLLPDYGAEAAGMRIAEVTAGGPAARAGLRAGDVIVRFGATPVRSVRDYMVGLEQARPGGAIEVEFLREGERRTAQVVPVFLSH